LEVERKGTHEDVDGDITRGTWMLRQSRRRT
jgi:hypothetical protein